MDIPIVFIENTIFNVALSLEIIIIIVSLECLLFLW